MRRLQFSVVILFSGLSFSGASECLERYECLFPKATLSSYAFVYCLDGKPYVELSNMQYMLSKKIGSMHPEISSQANIPSDIEEWVFQKIPENKNSVYSILMFNGSVIQIKLCGLRLRADRDGMLGQFCIDEQASEHFGNLNCNVEAKLHPVAIALQTKSSLVLSSEQNCNAVAADLKELESALESVSLHLSIEREEMQNFSLNRYGVAGQWNTVYIGACTTQSGRVLFAFGNQLKDLIAFPESQNVTEGIHHLSARDGNCLTISDGDFFVFPDLDGDCLPEILVVSSSLSQFFRFVGNAHSGLILLADHWTYVGP